MIGYPNLAPFLAQDAVGIDQEGAALYAEHLATVHVLFLDDVEQLADLLIGIRQELERQLVLLLDTSLRTQCIARDADDQGVGGGELGRQVTKALRLLRA